MLCGCGCAFVLINLEARHHLVHDGVGVVEDQFGNCYSSFSEFKVSFMEVMFKIVSCFVRLVGAFSHPDVVFEDSLPVENKKGEVCCLTLSQLFFVRSCLFNQGVDGVEDDVNWLGRVVDHGIDGGCIVVRLLRGDASIVAV